MMSAALSINTQKQGTRIPSRYCKAYPPTLPLEPKFTDGSGHAAINPPSSIEATYKAYIHTYLVIYTYISYHMVVDYIIFKDDEYRTNTTAQEKTYHFSGIIL